MLTARTEETDGSSASAGADDYMTKPFSPKELHGSAVLRRAEVSHPRRT
jgi:DNA-binding response OmpR family regulator